MSAAVSTNSTLAAAETARLVELEGVVSRGLQTFIEVGKALREIRDSKLYRQHFETFEDYCRDRWGFSERRGRQLIDAAQIGTVVPVENEAQARELAPLADDEAAIVEVWSDLKAKHGDAVTAERVKRTVDLRLGRDKREADAADSRREKRELVPPVVCDGCGASMDSLLASREGWKFPWGERGSHGAVYGLTYCRSCYLASGLAAEDARQYADDLDEGRGYCHVGHGWGDGRYEWGCWSCSRCEADHREAMGEGCVSHAAPVPGCRYCEALTEAVAA